jgi:hypothetical protein
MKSVKQYNLGGFSVGDMIHVSSSMKIVSVIQAVLRGCLRNLRGCNVGILDIKDL